MENISLDDLELKRKNIKKNNFLRTLIGFVVLVISIVLGFATEILFLMFIGILAFAILLIINGTKKSEFTKHFKENIVRKLVQEELGTEAYYDPKGSLKLSEINSVKCTSGPDRWNLGDYIHCSYNGVPYEICDCHFEERRVTRDSKGNRQVRYVTFFKGRIIKIDFQRDLNINMKIVNQGPMGFDSERLTKFETEVIDFNKKFKCYVDNTENGFYILTPMFIQKLLELEKMFRGGLVFAFKYNNLYVFINDSSDSLEVSFNKPLNGEQIERIRGEIILPATIINEFRIDDDKFNINR